MRAKGRILSLLLVFCLVAGLLPTAAFAAGTDTGKAIQIGASGISGYDSTNGYDYIYYGTWSSDPIKWRVLDTKTNMANATEGDGLFLLSDVLLGTGNYGGVHFDNTVPYSNAWHGSDAQDWCETFYSDSLTTQEQGAVLATTKSDKAYKSSYDYQFASSENILNGDKVFFLSAQEAESSEYGFTNDTARIANYGNSAGSWWLRSPNANYTYYAGLVYDYGQVYSDYLHDDHHAVRPAFNLNRNSVLFTSAAVGGKIPAAGSGGNQGGVGADAIFEIGAYTGNEWKLTLLDSSRNFSVTEETASGKPGDTITLNYTGATVYNAATAPNEYISVIIADSSDSVLYYGRVAQPGEATGTATITIPSGLTAGNYTLKVFSEQCNGDKMTDYASAFQDVVLHVHSWSAAWSSDDDHHWHDCTAARCPITDNSGKDGYGTHTFGGWTTNNNGTHTQACTCGEQKTSNCTYDGEGKCTVCGYARPIYTISADTASLDFGSAAEGYTTAPAAQTVTILNTGSQTVTLTQPTATDFNIGNLSATELAAGATATFTVQPKTGLAAGNHSETLNISGSDGTSASVKLSFTVNAVYTLTVNLNGGSGSATGGQYPAGEVVNIDAGSRSSYRFTGWTTSNGGSFADASSASTTFTMPAADTTITATWSYNGGGGVVVNYYRLTFDVNGGSEIAPISRAANTTVDLSGYTPTREGYEFTGWYADEDLTDKITSIRLTRNTTIYAGWKEIKDNPSTGFENPFTDVSESDWFYEDVMFVFANDLMIGTSDTTFSPEISTSRAMIAVTLWRMEGKPEPKGANPFTDVENGVWYTEAITWANENGIAEGYGNGCFQPETPVTREQLAAFFYRYAEYKGYDITITGSLDRFNDKDNVSDWAKEAMAWAVGYGLIGGKGNNMLDPQGEATRAEFAAMLHRFCQKG